MVSLSEWNPSTGKLRPLARLPRIASVIPDATSEKIAVLASPRRGLGLDLWVLDRRSRQLKLLRPGMSVETRGQSAPRWDGDRLIFYRDSRTGYWSIRADGSDLRQVLSTPKEARDD